jgi:hypothetical protein
MPRPLTPADPPESRLSRSLRLGFRHVKNVTVCSLCLLTGLYVLREVRPPLWPIWFPVYASCNCCQLPRNTRYGRLARPYPAGTSTRQETPSLLGALASPAFATPASGAGYLLPFNSSRPSREAGVAKPKPRPAAQRECSCRANLLITYDRSARASSSGPPTWSATSLSISA